MVYENVIQIMLDSFPELLEAYIQEGDYIRGLPHVAFSVILCRYARDVYFSSNEKSKERIAIFIEEMLDSDDTLVKELVTMTIMCDLYYYGLYDVIRPYLGYKSQLVLDEQPL